MTNLLFGPPFGGLRSNVRTSSMPRWKVRSQLPIRNKWTFFASFYGWDVLSRYWSKSALFRGGGSLWAQILGGGGRRPPTIVGMFLLPHCEDRMILSSFIWIGYQCVTDRIQWSTLQAMRPRCKNWSYYSFVWYHHIGSVLFRVVIKHVCDRRTDRQTDGQNYDRQDRVSIAASRG